jgi:voltage-gated potassium channel
MQPLDAAVDEKGADARVGAAGASAPSTALERERLTLLEHVHAALDSVMVVLSLAWIALLVADLVSDGLPRSLDIAFWAIWALFVLDFALEFSIAPSKRSYLRTHWLTAVSLMLPALRVVRAFAALRVLRGARVIRSTGLLRILTSVNRGLASLRATAARRGVGYLLAATVLVIAVGAAGMASFESRASLAQEGVSGGRPLDGYADALWWTAYAMTTGATHQPSTPEGRLLGWLLSLYGLAVFGYLTATLASHFVGREREATGRAPTDESQSRTHRRPI